jgi:RNA polymerase sigma-70 factor (ECF subfamily)
MMWLEWRNDRISFIHDYRHARYVVADVELLPAQSGHAAGDGTPG